MRNFSNVNPEFEASKEASLKIRTIIVELFGMNLIHTKVAQIKFPEYS